MFKEISEALINGDEVKVRDLVEEALNEGEAAEAILKDALLPGMDVVSEYFKNDIFFVPEVLLSSNAMLVGLEVLKPFLLKEGVSSVGKVVIGTVWGDIHEIGKNIVASLLKGAGFEVIDLGVDVSPDKFIQAIQEEKPDILGMSALMTTTMLSMKKTIDLLDEKNLREKVKVIVGGAPVSEIYAQQIGADAYAEDGSSAIDKARNLLTKKKRD